MKGKLLFVAGLATGYVVGARAGRSAYTALTESLRTARRSEALQSVVGTVKQVAQERVPALSAAVSTAAATTASVAEAVSTAPDPESEAASEPESAEPQQRSVGKRAGRGKPTGASAPESAEEAARVFEEQLPPTDAGESAAPTATS